MHATFPSFQELDQLLRSGHGAEVRKTLGELDASSLNRDQLADWANLARRAGLISLSLRLLQPVLRLKKNIGQPPTPKERASYAASLGAIGALSEAIGVLSGLEQSPLPEVQLFYGFTHVYSWDYGAAAPFFQRYTELEGPSQFQKAVARVNLAAAHCFLGGYDEVLKITQGLLSESAREKWVILQTESHLLAAQACLNHSRFEESQAHIDAAQTLSAENNLNLLHVQKWNLLLELKKHGPKPAVLEAFADFKTQVATARNWEITRDCDYQLGLATKDKKLLERVYFGTPFAAYRTRLLSEAAGWFQPRSTYTWALGEGAGPVLDLDVDDQLGLKRADGSIFIRVLRSMCTDFYRPLKIGCLHNEMYPGEFYDPESSPARVRTSLSRARALLRESGLPLEIVCVKQDYHLAASGPLSLKVRIQYDDSASPAFPPNFFKDLKKVWAHKSFTSVQAAETLSMPRSQVQRLLKVAADESRLYKSGQGRSLVYRFSK